MSWRPYLRSQMILCLALVLLCACGEEVPEIKETKMEDLQSESIKESMQELVSDKKTVVDSVGKIAKVPKTKKEIAKAEQLKKSVAQSDFSTMTDAELKSNLETMYDSYKKSCDKNDFDKTQKAMNDPIYMLYFQKHEDFVNTFYAKLVAQQEACAAQQ